MAPAVSIASGVFREREAGDLCLLMAAVTLVDGKCYFMWIFCKAMSLSGHIKGIIPH